MVGEMTEKKRAAGRKLVRVDEGNLRLAAAELVVRTIQEVTDDLASGNVKLSGFSAKDAARRTASRTRAAGRRRGHGSGQHR
jgi:hypothetical protein